MMTKAAAAKALTAVGLSRGEVHLWTAALDHTPDGWPHHLECLSPDERARAERFRFDLDRYRFIAARATLREILGNYLGVPAREILFKYGPYGKPALANDTAGDIEFNLSHCRGLALVAVAAALRVGVDLEFVSSGAAKEHVAERFFSATEIAALSAVPRGLRDEAFFACWTRKEAYLKGRGEGLSTPLDAFSVSLAPGEPAALLGCSVLPEEARSWSLKSFTPAAGFLAAVAVEGQGWQLRRRQWTPMGLLTASVGRRG